MKKIISMLVSCLSLVCLSSCNSEPSGAGDLDTPVFCLTSDMDEPIVLAEGRSKSVKLNVKAEKLGPAANMTFTVDADMKLVSSYNEKIPPITWRCRLRAILRKEFNDGLPL